jgi:hypothetical protein
VGPAHGLRLECAELDGTIGLRIRGLAEPLIARLRGLHDAQLGELLGLFPEEALRALRAGAQRAAAPERLQPMAGRYRIETDSICFVPRFPLIRGTVYSVLIHPLLLDSSPADLAGAGPVRDLAAASTRSATRPADAAEPDTEVIAVYPSGAELPVNQLKLYVHFSNPMSEGCAARHVRLVRADTDQEIEAAFLDMQPELWDRERRRLTLLLDPGRIKRGLVPNQTDGYPLRVGMPVRLAIDAGFRDHSASRLVRSFSCQYRVGSELRSKLDPSDWQYEYPRAGTLQPLVIRFDRPLDHALLQHCIRVWDGAGKPALGEPAVFDAESAWRFTPEVAWHGDYCIRIDSKLEDLAGNSLARVFDRDLERADDAPRTLDRAEQRFSCGPG